MLRFGLSLWTCFDWDEAHLIASADWMLDGNKSTHAEMHPIKKNNKIQWHAFGHADQRFNELWLRTVEEPDLELRLVKLGQFMHFLEDWESHAGYGTRMGHGRDSFRGRDPDSLANNLEKNWRMVQSAIDHLLLTCRDIGRLAPEEVDRELVRVMRDLRADGLIQDLYDNSDPKWKRHRVSGGLSKRGKRILRENQERIEEAIERYWKDVEAKNIPADFEPGENGLPLFLELPYDREGNLLLEHSAQDPDDIEEASDELPEYGNLIMQIEASRWQVDGWYVRLELINESDVPVAAADVDVLIVDSATEQVIGSTTKNAAAIAADDSVKLHVFIPLEIEVDKEDIIVGAVSRVQDFSATDNEVWFMNDDVAEEQPEVPIIADLDDPEFDLDTMRIHKPPEFWIEPPGDVCTVMAAIASDGDSSEKIRGASFSLISPTGSEHVVEPQVPPRWSITQTGTKQYLAAKSFACFSVDKAFCEAIPHSVGLRRPSLKVEIVGKDAMPVSGTFELPVNVYSTIRNACENAP